MTTHVPAWPLASFYFHNITGGDVYPFAFIDEPKPGAVPLWRGERIPNGTSARVSEMPFGTNWIGLSASPHAFEPVRLSGRDGSWQATAANPPPSVDRVRLAAETERIERQALRERNDTGSVSESTLEEWRANQAKWQATT